MLIFLSELHKRTIENKCRNAVTENEIDASRTNVGINLVHSINAR